MGYWNSDELCNFFVGEFVENINYSAYVRFFYLPSNTPRHKENTGFKGKCNTFHSIIFPYRMELTS